MVNGMPIASLSENTIRALGSSQVLTDATSVVKELVDNALDAHATSISVEISENALDVIQVRDNGHGIAPGDRGMLCRRYSTSKIKDFSDLSNIGGTSLGFRGEALASAVELSGSLTITTKIGGEPVATALKFERDAGQVSQSRVSHPEGTTVRVIDFLKHLPVRRQTACKTSAKMTTKIKTKLRSYALARPSTRFSQKVIKKKNDKADWTYTPTVGATMSDAASKIFGQGATAQCNWYAWSSAKGTRPSEPEDHSSDVPNNIHDEFTIESLIPRKDCEIPSINNNGQYLSIDSRPVSICRGTLKQLVRLYKSYIKSALSKTADHRVVDPLLLVNIVCPRGSYDVNIEPAKDDVLFMDPPLILSIFECFLKTVYGEIPINSIGESDAGQQIASQNCFDFLLRSDSSDARLTVGNSKDYAALDIYAPLVNVEADDVFYDQRHSDGVFSDLQPGSPPNHARGYDLPKTSTTSSAPMHNDENTAVKRTQRKPGTAWKSSMYDEGENIDSESDYEDLGSFGNGEDEQFSLSDVKLSNPWTIAMLNSSVRCSGKQSELKPRPEVWPSGQLLTPKATGQRERSHNHDLATESDAQQTSITSQSLPLKVTNFSQNHLLSPSTPSPFALGSRRKVCRQDSPTALPRGGIEETGNSPLDQWIQRGQVSSAGSASATRLNIGTPLDRIPDVRLARQRQSSKAKQITSRVNLTRSWQTDDRTSSIDTPLSQSLCRDGNQNSNVMHRKSQRNDFFSSSPGDEAGPMHPDLALTMDFEKRKQIATTQRRNLLLQRNKPLARDEAGKLDHKNSSISIHGERYQKAIAALQSSKPQRLINLDPSDPRAYLADIHSSAVVEPTHKLSRQRTAHLPLESVPADDAVHDLVLAVQTAQIYFRKKIKKSACYDKYIACGENMATGLEASREEVECWEVKLNDMLAAIRQRDGVGDLQEEDMTAVDLWSILQTHRSAVDIK